MSISRLEYNPAQPMLSQLPPLEGIHVLPPLDRILLGQCLDIDLRRIRVLMTEHLLDKAHILPLAEQVQAQRVPEGVRQVRTSVASIRIFIRRKNSLTGLPREWAWLPSQPHQRKSWWQDGRTISQLRIAYCIWWAKLQQSRYMVFLVREGLWADCPWPFDATRGVAGQLVVVGSPAIEVLDAPPAAVEGILS